MQSRRVILENLKSIRFHRAGGLSATCPSEEEDLRQANVDMGTEEATWRVVELMGYQKQSMIILDKNTDSQTMVNRPEVLISNKCISALVQVEFKFQVLF